MSRLVRRFIDLANEMEAAGYTVEEAKDIKRQVDYYNNIKDEIKLKSGDALDLKYYDPAMRQLIDNYVRAEDSEKLVDLADISFPPLLIRACLIAFLLTRTVKTSFLPGRTVPSDGVTVKKENSSFL